MSLKFLRVLALAAACAPAVAAGAPDRKSVV